ncbi:MAG: zinc ABC transporter solute-binding protein [Verrucomicrobia bacterium]|nr:zinc ABC transporter solute-binding protein [Verrucomicrobiota bacterium]
MACWFFTGIFVLGMGVGCAPDGEAPSRDLSEGDGQASESEVPTFYVVNYPLYYFTKRIVGERARVVLPKSSGADPAFWQPSEAEVLEYQNADLILLWGADFAKWVQNVSLPLSRVIDTGASIRDRYIYDEEAVSHSHGDSEAHSHGAIAFTTWLDFELMIHQSREIYESISNRYPRHAVEYGQSYRALEADLMSLDRTFNELIPESFDETVFASHPVYQYFGRRYGLEIQSFHWEPGVMPDEAEWNNFEDRLKENKVKWMLWEGAPSEETKARLQKSGVLPIEFHTVGGSPETGDFLTVMQANVERLRDALQAR